jgi:hypothetical protein
MDVLTLKNECNCTVDEITETTPYEFDFVNFVIIFFDVESDEKKNLKSIKIILMLKNKRFRL